MKNLAVIQQLGHVSMKVFILLMLITVFSSCEEEEVEPDPGNEENPILTNPTPSPTAELPTSFMGHWYAEDGYSYSAYFIAEDYIKTSGTEFAYSEDDVTESGGVYTIVGTSSSNTGFTFRIQADGDQLKIASNSNSFESYWDSPATELPANAYAGWYTYEGVLRFDIKENGGDRYVASGNISYFFSARDVTLLEPGVYKIDARSSSNASKSFFLKAGDENEYYITVNSDYNSNFRLLWNSEQSIPIIPEQMMKKWFKVGASKMTYRVLEEAGQYMVRDLSAGGGAKNYTFDPKAGDVKKTNANNFVVEASENGNPKTYYFRKSDDFNRLEISEGNASSFEKYYNATGKTIVRANYSGGYFMKVSNTEWAEYKDNGNGQVHATFTFDRDGDWGVYLTKTDGARILIDMWTKEIKAMQYGGSTWNILFDITSAESK